MRAIWIEDHELIVDALEVLMQVRMPELSLDKARDWPTAWRMLLAIPYDLVLLDWWLGAEDATAAMRQIASFAPPPPIIVVSGDDRPAMRKFALSHGACACVSKNADPSVLVDTIRQTLGRGAGAPSSDGAWDDATPRLAPLAPTRDVTSVFPGLTPRQCDVFRALMRGRSDKQIARELQISDTTVKTHVRAILLEVGAHTRGEAAHEARRRGAGDC